MSEAKSQNTAHPSKAPFPDGSFTPGPWRARLSGDPDVLSADGDLICAVYTDERGEDDARLIAAAPDLYEALCLAHDYLAANGWEGDERLKPIRAALAKAGASHD